jgi:hypothetical protein
MSVTIGDLSTGNLQHKYRLTKHEKRKKKQDPEGPARLRLRTDLYPDMPMKGSKLSNYICRGNILITRESSPEDITTSKRFVQPEKS